MSIRAKLTDGKVELTDGWTNRVLCALDITSAALLATKIQAIAAVYKVKAPAPMPPPALGMRAYGTYPPERDGTVSLTESDDIYHLKPGAEWCDYLDPAARVDLIVDFRTREVLWRRS